MLAGEAGFQSSPSLLLAQPPRGTENQVATVMSRSQGPRGLPRKGGSHPLGHPTEDEGVESGSADSPVGQIGSIWGLLRLGDHRPYLDLKRPRRTPHTHEMILSSPPAVSWPICFLSPCVCLFWILHENGLFYSVAFASAPLTFLKRACVVAGIGASPSLAG